MAVTFLQSSMPDYHFLERNLPTKSWKFISLGLNDDQGFRLGCIWKANSSDLNQGCYELGSRIILFWIVDLEPEGIKVAEHYVAV